MLALSPTSAQSGTGEFELRNDPVGAVYVARATRDFGDGFVAVLLPVHLANLGLGPFEIGVVASAALAGSAAMTLAVGRYASRFDPRALLIAAACLMATSGIAFAWASSYAAILAVAFVGTVNPSSGSVGIFGPLEQSVLAGRTADSERTRMFARYALIGAMAGASGALAAGSPDLLAYLGLGRDAALDAMFLIYAGLGVAGGIAYRRIPPEPPKPQEARASLGPSRAIVRKLAALFALDSFAGGFAVQSLMALWLFRQFDLSLAAAGLFFFWSGVLSAFSFPVAAWLAARIGLINTMVWTHIPSSLCLIAAAFAPNVETALGLLLVRAALSQMDVPTRSSYVMAVVTPAERPAAASYTAVPRGIAAAIAPSIAGALFAAGADAGPLIACGVLKIAYDLALLWTFRDVKPPEER
jgi:MFS family permease